jgi:membrane protein
MDHQMENEGGGSIVRSFLIAVGAVFLFLTGQRRSALVIGVAYAAIDGLANLRSSGLGARLLAETGGTASTGALPAPQDARRGPPRTLFSRSQAPSDHLEVETKRRPASPSARSGGGNAGKGSTGSNKSGDSGKSSGGPLGFFKSFADKHPNAKAFVEKVGKDNIGMLAAFVAWTTLTSIVPIIVGLVAISGLFLRNPSAQASVVSHIQAATQGTFSKTEIMNLVHLSTEHTGILGLIGIIGILWGGSSLGGSVSTAFQAIFETTGRNFIKEKLIDVGMLFVFTALMLVIVAGSAAGSIVTTLVKGVPVPGLVEAIGLAISFISAYILFMAIYLVFPNIEPPFKFGNVWKGALVSAALFTILSLIWPIYAHFQNFGKYGQLLSSILLLTAWIYFFCMIMMAGAEVVAFAAIEQAHDEGKELGPEPQESVPQHSVLRDAPAPH